MRLVLSSTLESYRHFKNKSFSFSCRFTSEFVKSTHPINLPRFKHFCFTSNYDVSTEGDKKIVRPIKEKLTLFKVQ